MGRVKSLIVTLTIMGMLWWCYELTDMYAWSAHQILNGILVVSGMLGIGGGVYVFLRLSDQELKLLSGKRRKENYGRGNSGQWQR